MMNVYHQKLSKFHIILVHNNSILHQRWFQKMSILIFHMYKFSSRSSVVLTKNHQNLICLLGWGMSTSKEQIIFLHLTPTFLGGFGTITNFKDISGLTLISDSCSANVQITGRAAFPGRTLSTKPVIAQRIKAQWVVGSISSAVIWAPNQLSLGTTLRPGTYQALSHQARQSPCLLIIYKEITT